MTERDGERSQDKTLPDLQKVLEITRSMAATVDLDALLNLIIDRSVELLGVRRATLFLYDAATDELVSRIATGVKELRIPAGRGICGATIETGRTLIVPDAYADPRFNPQIDRETGFRTRNILSVPLRDFEGSLVGVLQALNKRDGAFDDYDVTLAETLAAQAGVAIQRADLIEHFLQKQQMERAMKIAREIQRSLLPEGSPSVEGFDIAGFAKPADETGGDAYDFFPLGDGRWMILVADASGHGIGPALVIAETRSMIRALCAGAECNLASVLDTVNRLLCEDLQESRFVTCMLGVLDPDASTLTYASAGHGPLIFGNCTSGAFEKLPATALPLGIMPESEYTRLETRLLKPGDIALIITDGFFEAVNAAGEEFGIDRIIDLLRRRGNLPAERMIAALHESVAEFTAGQPQADDLTAIAIRRI